VIENMAARDGVEPPAPAFSELIVPVFPTTSMVVVGLLNTGKYKKTSGSWVIAVGDSEAQESSLQTCKISPGHTPFGRQRTEFEDSSRKSTYALVSLH
jgi:predicted AlkP superfamily pyrophosphatase or phosphodiesterase